MSELHVAFTLLHSLYISLTFHPHAHFLRPQTPADAETSQGGVQVGTRVQSWTRAESESEAGEATGVVLMDVAGALCAGLQLPE